MFLWDGIHPHLELVALEEPWLNPNTIVLEQKINQLGKQFIMDLLHNYTQFIKLLEMTKFNDLITEEEANRIIDDGVDDDMWTVGYNFHERLEDYNTLGEIVTLIARRVLAKEKRK